MLWYVLVGTACFTAGFFCAQKRKSMPAPLMRERDERQELLDRQWEAIWNYKGVNKDG